MRSLALVLSLASLAGCRETRTVRWELAFLSPGDRARAAVVVAEVRPGTCLDDAAAIYRAEIAPTEAAPPVSMLGGGVHAFSAVARDADCVEIARGCVDVVLPTDEGRVVRTELASDAGGGPICAACAEGRCDGGALDAGQDAAVPPDAPPPDAPPSDSGPAGPDPPILRAPWNGWVTGRGERSPPFAWREAPGATRYELAVDATCATPASCAFGAAAIVAHTVTTIAPGVLRADPSAPIVGAGARVHWRVRSCAITCGAWSETRWLDVDRERRDVDGDGDGDLLIGAPGEDRTGADGAGAVHLYRGSATGWGGTPVTIALTPEADAWLGSAIDLGDVDGDGLADAVIGIEESGATDLGRVVLLRGDRAAGLDATRPVFLAAPPDAPGFFGQSVAIVDDTDGDGYRDVLVGSSRDTAPGRAYLYRGSATALVEPTPTATYGDGDGDGRFGFTVAGAGDVDGDGHADLLIGEPFATIGANAESGRAHVVRRGGTDVLTGPIDPRTFFGFSLAGLGDVSGDMLGDVAIGAPYADLTTGDGDQGYLYIHLATESGAVSPDPIDELTTTAGYTDVHSGWSVAVGHLDGDGIPDVAVPLPAIDVTSTSGADRGVINVFRGDGDGSFTYVDTLYCGEEEPDMEFGRSVALIDGDGDGIAEVVGGAHRYGGAFAAGTGGVWWFSDALGTEVVHALPAPWTAGPPLFGWALPGSVGRLPADL